MAPQNAALCRELPGESGLPLLRVAAHVGREVHLGRVRHLGEPANLLDEPPPAYDEFATQMTEFGIEVGERSGKEPGPRRAGEPQVGDGVVVDEEGQDMVGSGRRRQHRVVMHPKVAGEQRDRRADHRIPSLVARQSSDLCKCLG